MDLPSYREMVGDQAITFEERMRAAGVRIVAEAGVDGWVVQLQIGGRVIVRQAPLLPAALYLAATQAGLTEGLNPPPEGVQR